VAFRPGLAAGVALSCWHGDVDINRETYFF
jgi:hypothetical protein